MIEAIVILGLFVLLIAAQYALLAPAHRDNLKEACRDAFRAINDKKF